MIYKFATLLLLIPYTSFSQFGPGGVGNSSNNGLWLKADDLTLSNGSPVVTWNDRSGNNNHATNTTLAEQPVFNSSSLINGRPSVYFDGVLDQMIIADDNILDGTIGITYYTVIRPDNLDGKPRGILGKRTSQTSTSDYSYTFFFYTSNYVNLDLDRQNDRFSSTPSAFVNNTNYMLGFDFDGFRATATRARLLNAGNVIVQSTESSNLLPAGNAPLVLGGLNESYFNSGQKRLGGDYAEVLHYNRSLNTAERKIVENYLGAKYGIAVLNPLYAQPGYNGEVAGIGRDNTTNSHNDAQGSAMVRINSPSSLNDGDFMLWGHNESSLMVNNTTDVDGTVIESRMSRVWGVTKTNDVGTVNVIFDLSVFSPITPSDVRLLIDRNGNGFADNDVSPISGSVSGSTITFTGVNFVDNDKFTLGSIDSTRTPLPVELTDFHLESKKRSVNVMWTTASELNADYYLLSKSKDGKTFKTFAEMKANGTTSSTSHYKEIDKSPYSGVSYYQLTQVDFDGRETKYGPVSVNRQQDQSFVLVPNPTNGAFKLKSAIAVEEETKLSVYNSIGKLEKEVNISPKEINTEPIDLNLLSGVYFVKITQDNGFFTSMKLVVK